MESITSEALPESTGKKIDADLVFEKPFQVSDLEKSILKLLTNR